MSESVGDRNRLRWSREISDRWFKIDRDWSFTHKLILFLVLSASVFAYQGRFDVLEDPPMGYHAWRQADAASLAYMYFIKDNAFAEPELLNQNQDFLESGFCAPSEAPILYFSLGKLYQWVGYQPWIHRTAVLLIFTFGWFVFFHGLSRWLDSTPLSIVLSTLFLCSPVIFYYCSNYLNDAVALGLAIAGMGYLFLYERRNEKRSFFLALLCLTLAGLMKVTALLIGLAFFGAWLLRSFRQNTSDLVMKLVGLLIMVAFPAAWLIYAHQYNEEHLCYYFSTGIFPVWDLSFDEAFRYGLDTISRWWKQFYSPLQWILILVALPIVWRSRQVSTTMKYVVLFTLIGVLIYVLLQFRVLYQHDYYFLNLFILPLLIVSLLGKVMKSSPSMRWWPLVLLPLLIWQQVESKEVLNERTKDYGYPKNKSLLTLDAWLTRNGVGRDQKLIYGFDDSNVSLYYLKRMGWTQYGYPLTEDQRMKDSELYRFRLEVMVKNGAAFLLLDKEDHVMEQLPELEHVRGERIADTLSFSLFKIKPPKVEPSSFD